jgi:hypothetical protein
MVSERTRAAEAVRRFAQDAAPLIREVQASGVASLRGIAAVLNACGVRTARGGRWAATQVAAVLALTSGVAVGERGSEKQQR